MRVIALYLPQFYRIPENDKWWGEGYTDWVSARQAVPLFDGHYQPHVPLNDNYYDLSRKDTMIWQADLMKQYGIDGLCFYHYWFENGRRILEKPAENLLEWTDIDMPFCFSWANETWARSWSGIKGTNVWSEVEEHKSKDNDGVLLRQEYGDKKAWEEHFMYLLPFFKDKRYIKEDGRPIFMIYKADQIHCLEKMLDCWRKLAQENGLEEIYVIGGNSEGISTSIVDAHYHHEPVYANRKVMQGMYGESTKRLSYSEVWNEILKERKGDDQTYFGGFVGYDDSPRRGKKGIVVENGTPQLFGGFLAQLMAKNEAVGSDITFINAWNEWGEGMHLEPDEKYEYAYLQQIKYAKNNYREFVSFYSQIEEKDFEDRNAKHELYLNDLDKWMTNRENGARVGDWLVDKGFLNVAVYGYGILGRHLITELFLDERISISCLIDKEHHRIKDGFPCLYPGDNLPKADIIIVSSYYYLDSIKSKLPENIRIVSLRDIILEQYDSVIM